MTRLGVAAALVDGVLVPGDVELADGRVAAVGLPPVRGGGTAVPGLVDLQVNGYGGVDLLTSSADEWREASRRMARDGVTSFVANLVTAAEAMTSAALAVAGEVAASPVDGVAPVDAAALVDGGTRSVPAPGVSAPTSRVRSSPRAGAGRTRSGTCAHPMGRHCRSGSPAGRSSA